MNLDRIIIAALAAGLVGMVYALLVHWVYDHSPDHPYTAILVVFGVAATLAIALIAVPAEWVLITAGLFIVTGTPQIVGSMIREEQLRQRAKAEAKRQIEETLS